ncbi:MAG: EAL domain-containing protein [Acidobacteriota bacterium]
MTDTISSDPSPPDTSPAAASVDSEAHARRLTAALRAVADGVILLDAEGRIDEVNPAGAALLGIARGELIGHRIDDLVDLTDEQDQEVDLAGPRRRGDGLTLVEGTQLTRRLGGGQLIVEGRQLPLDDGGAALVLRDVGDRQRMTHKLSRAAQFDALTGLLNRESFDQHLLDAIDSGDDFVLGHLDLDRFQLVNETCGHSAGDALLQWVASLVRESVSGADVVARTGGDEIGLLLRGDLDQASHRADEIHTALREFRFVWQAHSLKVAASIGLVPVATDLGGLQDHCAAADRACQLAKQHGRGRTEVYRQDAEEIRRQRGWMSWVVRARRALDDDHFVLWWQRLEPLQAASPHKPLYEILVRLRDDDGRIRSAGEFLPAVERFGLAPHLDRWMIRHALQTLARHPELLDIAEAVTINLSGASLDVPDLAAYVEDELAASGIDGSRIGFEITETAAVQSLEQAQTMIERLRGCGVRWLLDDFGSGMSSYGYLRELPIDYLKIDGKIVTDARSGPLGRTMVESIHQIGHVIGARTVAEHVDGDDLLQMMGALGIDYVQGYHVDEPGPMVPAATTDAAAPPRRR